MGVIKHKKGFTLVEVIVVLVILAVLAAILVPSYVKYVKVAEEKAIISDCRNCVLAAQGLLSESYDSKETSPSVSYTETEELAGVKGTIMAITTENWKIYHLTYIAEDLTVYYCSKGGCDVCGNKEKYKVVRGSINGYQQQANGAFKNLSSKFMNDYQSKIDGVNSDKKGTKAYELFNSLSKEDQAFLNSVSWSFAKVHGTDWRLYFTTTKYSADETLTDVKIYKYHPETGQYQYSNTGKITNGKISESLPSYWSDWSDTID